MFIDLLSLANVEGGRPRFHVAKVTGGRSSFSGKIYYSCIAEIHRRGATTVAGDGRPSLKHGCIRRSARRVRADPAHPDNRDQRKLTKSEDHWGASGGGERHVVQCS